MAARARTPSTARRVAKSRAAWGASTLSGSGLWLDPNTFESWVATVSSGWEAECKTISVVSRPSSAQRGQEWRGSRARARRSPGSIARQASLAFSNRSWKASAKALSASDQEEQEERETSVAAIT
eukprot:9478870-Pyramimonas_sp.AAC.1